MGAEDLAERQEKRRKTLEKIQGHSEGGEAQG